MKRCPECYEAYENTDKFCEVDGQRLLADPAPSVVDENALSYQDVELNRGPLVTGLIGMMVGIVLCSGVYVIYSVWTAESGPDVQQTPAYVTRMQDPAPPNRAAPAPIPELSQETEAAPSPEENASPESTLAAGSVPESQTVAARLNEGPVSTGQAIKDGGDGTKVRTIIQMKDGTSLEVDAAWEDKQGIWYRRGGLVAFIEGERVKAITSRQEPKTSPAPSQ